MDCTNHTIDEWSDFQRLLFDVSDGKTKETAEELIESNFIQTEKDIIFLLNNLNTAMRSNPGKLKFFALFIKHIILKFDESLNFPQHFLDVFHSYDKFTFILYRELFLLGFVQIEDIVAEFHDPKYPKNVRRTLLITFLPELYKYDQETVNMAFNELSDESDLFKTQITITNYEKNIETIAFLLKHGQEKNSLSLAIKNDDVEQLKKIVDKTEDFDYKQLFQSSEFELVPVDNLPIITAAAMFGSISCFKHLFLNNALSTSDDNMSQQSSSRKEKPKNSNSGKRPRSPSPQIEKEKEETKDQKQPIIQQTNQKILPIAHAAVYGGNHEILHILHQNKLKFDGTLAAAAKNFRPDIFEWLIATFPIAMIIKPVTANGILTELIRNCDFSSLICFFKSELKGRLVDKVTPIFHAVKAANAVCFSYIFNQLNTDPNTCNSSGYSLLHLVSDVDTANFLYSLSELDVAAVTKDGFTPLHEYASKGYVELGKMFLEHSNVSVSIQSSNGMTPLHCAASCGRADFIEFLLGCEGIDVNAVDRDGNTPLHYAARASSKRTVEQLLSCDLIDPNITNVYKETPYFLAAKLSNADVFSALADLPGVDINQKDSAGNTALIYAIERPCLSIFEYLLSVDTINVNIPDSELGRTPLMHIVAAPSCDEINQMFETMLIVHGLNINAQDKTGNTVIHIAADLEKRDLISRLLMIKGINMTLSNGKVTVKEASELKSKLGRRQKKLSMDFMTDSSDGGEIERRTRRSASTRVAPPQDFSSSPLSDSKLTPSDSGIQRPRTETPPPSKPSKLIEMSDNSNDPIDTNQNQESDAEISHEDAQNKVEEEGKSSSGGCCRI